MRSVERAELIEALDRVLRQVSGQSVLVSESVAERVGLAPTDLETLGVLLDEGAVTAGRLAEATGLTSGAVTRMIDRLERAGYVRREPDARDRRRVIVRASPDRLTEVFALYGPIQEGAHAVYEHYTDDQLRLILDFLSRSLEMGASEIARLRSGAGDRP